MRQPPSKIKSNEQVHVVEYEDLRLDAWRRFKCFRCGESHHAQRFGTAAPHITQTIARHYVHVLHPYCCYCRRARKTWIENHPDFGNWLDDFWRKKIYATKTRAFKARMICAIDLDDVVELFLNQDGRCAVTGLKMTHSTPGRSERGARAYAMASIDRINSHGNYTIGNVHLVIQAVNVMKNDLPMSAFLDLCELITAQRMSGKIAA